MNRTGIPLATTVVLTLFACSAPPPPAPAVDPAEETVTTPSGPATSARVTANKLNVRREPDVDAPVVTSLKKGSRIAVLRSENEWSQVRLPGGATGWVAAKYLRPDRDCPPDETARFVQAPVPSFMESPPRGQIVVEATVSKAGEVMATKVVTNTTGSSQLAQNVEKEIRLARFAPMVRNCVPIKFIYVYKRNF